MEKILKIALCGILILAMLILGRIFLHESYGDFRVYYEAAMNAKIFGTPYLVVNPHMSYLYPPITIFIFLPFTLFVIVLAEKIWLVTSLMLLVLCFAFLFRLLSISITSYEGLSYLILGAIFFPVKFTLGMGQINIHILFFLILFFYFYEKRKILSGLFLSLAIIIKISPVLFLGYLIYKEKWDIVYVVIVTILSLGIVSLVFFPLPTEEYFHAILPSLSRAWPTDYYNQSLTGFLGRLTVFQDAIAYSRLLVVALLLLITSLVIKDQRDNKNDMLVLSSILPVLLIISSFSWQHHFVFLIPSFIILSHYLLTHTMTRNQKIYLLLSVMISYVLVGYNIKNLENIPVLLQSHVLYGTLMLWGVHVYVLRKIA